MAGEAKNPGKSIPRAVVGSILISTIIYVLLQIAFIGAVNPNMIINGWSNLNFNSPFADLAIALNINWLVIVLYLDAFVSPSGVVLLIWQPHHACCTEWRRMDISLKFLGNYILYMVCLDLP